MVMAAELVLKRIKFSVSLTVEQVLAFTRYMRKALDDHGDRMRYEQCEENSLLCDKLNGAVAGLDGALEVSIEMDLWESGLIESFAWFLMGREFKLENQRYQDLIGELGARVHLAAYGAIDEADRTVGEVGREQS